MDRKQSLINYLYQMQKNCTVQQMGIDLNIPKRSVQRYLAEIKSEYPNLIHSDQSGYSINPAEYIKYTDQNADEYNLIKKMINLLVFSNDFNYDYELAEELYISISTLNKCLKKAKPILAKYQLTLSRDNGKILLTGTEKSKRQLIKDYLYGETYKSLMNPSGLAVLFPNYDIKQIQDCIINPFRKRNIFIDDYTLCNLILHIIIKIDRNADDHHLQTGNHIDALNDYKNKQYYIISKEICDKLAAAENVRFSQAEIYEFALLVSSTIHLETDSTEDFSHYLSDIVPSLVQQTKDVIYNIYDLDFNDSLFNKNFSLHLENLLSRLKNHIIIHNPLLDQIKNTYPFIYEMTIYIADCVLKPYGKISEDELAYITLHFVAQIEKIHNIQTKISCILISPEFYSLNKNVLTTLKEKFDDILYISDILSSYEEIHSLQAINYDLIITTVPLSADLYDRSVLINHLMPKSNIEKIRSAIEKIQKNKAISAIKKIINDFFNEAHFIRFDDIRTYEEIIYELSSQLIDKQLVPLDFAIRCIEREQISSTAFKEIAIPHSISAETKSTVFIALTDKHFVWSNGNKVKVVLLLVINKSDIYQFQPLFELVSGYMNITKSVDSLASSRSLQEFQDNLVDFMIRYL